MANMKDDFSIKISIDTSKIYIPSKNQDIQKALDKYKVYITPLVNFDEITKLENKLKELERTQTVNLTVNDSELKNTFADITKSVSESFENIFKRKLKGSNNPYEELTKSANQLKSVVDEVYHVVVRTDETIRKIDADTYDSPTTFFTSMTRNMDNLRKAFEAFGDEADGGGFTNIERNAKRAQEVIESLSNTFKEKPLAIDATINPEQLRKNLQGKHQEIQDILNEYDYDVNIKINPKIIDKETVTFEGFLDTSKTLNNVKDTIAFINGELQVNLASNKIKIPFDRDYFKNELKVVPIEINIDESFDEKYKILREQLQQLNKDAKSIKVDLLKDVKLDSKTSTKKASSTKTSTKKATTKTTDKTETAATSSFEVQLMNSMLALSKNLKDIYNAINELKQKGIALDSEAVKAGLKNVETSKKEEESLVSKNKLLKTYLSNYTQALAAREKLRDNEESDSFKAADTAVSAAKSNIDNYSQSLTEEERKDLDEIVRLETERITAQQQSVRLKKQEEASTASQNKLLNAYITSYTQALKIRERYRDNESSDSFTQADATVKSVMADIEKMSAGMTETERNNLKNILDIETKRITTQQESIRLRKQEEQEAKNLENSVKRIATNSEKYSDLASKMAITSKTADMFGTDRYDSILKDIEAYKALAAQIQSKYESNNLLNIDKDLEDLSELEKRISLFKSELDTRSKEKVFNTKEIDKLGKTSEELSRYLNKYGRELKNDAKLYQDLIDLQTKLASGNISSYDARYQFTQLKNSAREAGLEVDSLWKKLRRVFEARGRGLLANEGWMLLSMSMRDVARNVLEIDTAMTELKKVTEATDAEYTKFLDNAETRAKKLGATLVDTVSATADMARLGYNISDASNLADTALIYKNVGDDVESIDDASKSLISTMQGFNIAAEDSMTIVDKYNEVANRYASSAGDIGEITKRSAAAMKVAGSTLDETIALGVVANEVIQDSDSVGTAMKTMSMRLRSSKSDLEAAGEDTEGMADSVSKLRDEILALTGVDIMIDEDTFKSPYKMLMDLGEVWDSLTDVSRANVGELLFGKRQTTNCLDVWKQAS